MSSGQKAYFLLMAVMLLVIGIFFYKGRHLGSHTKTVLDRINAELDHLRPPSPDSDEALLKKVAISKQVQPQAPAAAPADTAGASAAVGGSSGVAAAAAASGASADAPEKGGVGAAIKAIRDNRARQDQKLNDAYNQ